jgi:cell division protein ZapA
MSRTVDLRVAGQNYRVVSSAPEQELQRLAAVVNSKLTELAGKTRGSPPQALLLAAIALAHELETERGQRQLLERRTRDLLRRVLARIDDALEPFDETEQSTTSGGTAEPSSVDALGGSANRLEGIAVAPKKTEVASGA